jgi:hypothetical protein
LIPVLYGAGGAYYGHGFAATQGSTLDESFNTCPHRLIAGEQPTKITTQLSKLLLRPLIPRAEPLRQATLLVR